jgi:hypothetical protein
MVIMVIVVVMMVVVIMIDRVLIWYLARKDEGLWSRR